MDTIFAPATAQGKAGISVIRVSGPKAFATAQALCGDVPKTRVASLRVLKNNQEEEIDEALVLTFDEDRSFTGEDTVEFQCHGSLAVTSSLLDVLGAMEGLRLAEPGEFTRRALENNRLDLAQIEGLADLVDAETEAQRKQAYRVLSGDLGRQTEEWRRKLTRAVALIEATIDFADEEVPVDVSPEVRWLLEGINACFKTEINGFDVSERIRLGFEVAIVGPPNAGKSTLLNYLAGRDAAITSRYAGTTRDVIEVRMDLGGFPVTLLDTAGLRETSDEVEAIGIDRARSRAKLADLRVILVEQGENPEFEPIEGDLVRVAKGDLLSSKSEKSVSGVTGLGVAELVDEIKKRISLKASGAGLTIRERHKEALVRGQESIEAALVRLDQSDATPEVTAEEIRTAVRALDSLIGRVDIENVLDEIFASFCLGK